MRRSRCEFSKGYYSRAGTLRRAGVSWPRCYFAAVMAGFSAVVSAISEHPSMNDVMDTLSPSHRETSREGLK